MTLYTSYHLTLNKPISQADWKGVDGGLPHLAASGQDRIIFTHYKPTATATASDSNPATTGLCGANAIAGYIKSFQSKPTTPKISIVCCHPRQAKNDYPDLADYILGDWDCETTVRSNHITGIVEVGFYTHLNSDYSPLT